MMFMNAPPRIVLNGFETFVPTHRTNLLHQRLVEMTNTNNDMKAWNGYGPVESSQNNSWEQSDNIETSYPVHNSVYGGYFQPSSASVSRPAVTPISSFGSYTVPNQQDQTYKRSLILNQDSTGMMNQFQQFQQPDPMLGVPWSGNNLGRSGFSDFVAGQQGFGGYPYGLNSNDMDIKPFSSQQSSAPSQPYAGQSSYNVGYPNYSPANMTLPSQPLGSFGVSATTTNSIPNTTWMSETPRVPNTPLHQNSLACYPTHHDLPNLLSTPQQQQGKSWNASNSTDMKWNPQASSPSTISPKQMHIANISPQGSFSYSASIPGSTPSQTDESSGADEDSDYAASEKIIVEKVEKPKPTRPARQKLPDSASSSSRRHVPVLPSNDYSSKSRKGPASPKEKAVRPSRAKHSVSGSAKLPKRQKSSKQPEPPTPTPKRIQPNGPTPALNWKTPPQTVMQAQSTPQQSARDQFLVESKLAGMSYKEIRRKGGFTEAESTLRGRFRTLTKHKADRVRKPEWSDNDIALLKRAVRKFTSGVDSNDRRTPWKQVAEHIVKYGGSYHFGNATCRKKWDELQEE